MINYDKKEYENATAFTGEYERLEPEGYICKILGSKVEQSKKGNDMLVLAVDIAEGKYESFFTKQFEEKKKNVKSPDQKAKYPNNAIVRCVLSGDNWINRFKGVIASIEKSNEGFDWEKCKRDESKLIGLKVGAIFSEEEYERLDGSVGIAVKIYQLRSTEAIENKNYKVPDIKRLPKKGDAFEGYGNFTDTDDDDLPF